MSELQIGIVGCGNISTAYLVLASQFAGYSIVACSDLNKDLADQQAAEFGCRSMSVEDLLSDSSIDLVVNLTIPAAHFEVTKAALTAGKHVYSEKPYVLSLEQGIELRELASAKNLRIGSAPDTFLGGSHQVARELIDAGDVGDIVGGSCYFYSHGMEDWHPQPDFFYQPGGGPILDMGAYYISNLVQLIGPVKRVVAMASKPQSQRTITSEPRAGEVLDVNVQTTVNAIMEFEQGAQITFGSSWDVWSSENNLIELHGTRQSMVIPDPNHFGGDVKINDGKTETVLPPMKVLSTPNLEDAHGTLKSNYRGIGLADMAVAITQGRDHRCSGELALHVIDVMLSILVSAESGQSENISTSCVRPEALPDAAAKLLLRQ